MEEAPEYLAERLRRRIAEDGRVNALGVEVAVRGPDVVLTGAVATEERRRVVDLLAREEFPGHTVHNHLTVTDLSGGHAPEAVG